MLCACSVTFKTTPCGLRVAIKGVIQFCANVLCIRASADFVFLRFMTGLATPKECLLLRKLTTGSARTECPGCFPQYFHYSNMTTACYSERMEPIPWGAAMSSVHATLSERGNENLKKLFLQGAIMLVATAL